MEKTNFYPESYVFDLEQGMDMAVAFSDFDNEREYDLDPSFGSLVFMTTEWKTFPNGTTIDTETILPSHACSA